MSESRKRSDLGDAVVARLKESGPATPYAIGKAIDRSAGAVAAASRYLIAEGRIARLSDKPVVFGLPGSELPPAAAKPAKKASKTKAVDRVAAYAAKKAQAASDKKVAEARRTKVAPSAGNPPIPAKAS